MASRDHMHSACQGERGRLSAEQGASHSHAAMWSFSACSFVDFSQPKPASQQYFSLTANQHQSIQTSPEINQRTGR